MLRGNTFIGTCGAAIILAVLLTAPVAAQTTTFERAWIPLPAPASTLQNPQDPDIAELPSLSNYIALDLARLDLLVGGRMRFWYTTEGSTVWKDALNQPLPLVDWRIHTGRLRPVDLVTPVPDVNFFLTNNGAKWPLMQASVQQWFLRPPVNNWNQILGGDDPATIAFAKGASLVGITSYRGTLFVNGPHRNDRALEGGQPRVMPWNGLSMLDGTDDPTTAFDPAQGVGKELFSTGTAADGTGFDRATPEGSTIVLTQPATGAGTFLADCNYCGQERAGYLLIQDITNMGAINPAARVLVPCYEYLGNYTEAPGTPGSGSLAPFGPEVPKIKFTAPYPADVSGNKMRPLTIMTVQSGLPNGDRKLLICGLNLDPVALSAGPPYTALDGGGRDDGKYDYLMITDVTEMRRTASIPVPLDDSWYFGDLAEWQSRVRFLRLPPDVPPGFDITQGLQALAANSGYDWSTVDVPHPSNPALSAGVQIVGSATIKSMTAEPTGRFLYVVSSDQGEDETIENPTFIDGGWQVPHLYVLDLGAGDFTSQTFLNGYTDDLAKYRFPKHVRYVFDLTTNPKIVGTTCVNATIPGFPITTYGPPILPAVGPTRLNGATAAQVGSAYPGEFQTDPTARTKLFAIENTNFINDQVRLYVGTKGRAQVHDDPIFGSPVFVTADRWRGAGGVHVLSLGNVGDADYGSPRFLKTITLPYGPSGTFAADPYQPGGLDVFNSPELLAPRATPAGDPRLARNIVVILAANGEVPQDARDRLVIVQDR